MWRYSLPGRFVTSEFVLLEVADGLSGQKSHRVALGIIDSIRKSASTEIVLAQPLWIERGYALFRQCRDKDWGLTDCISFEIMRDLGITDALTHDHHFEQAGFRALLRSDPPNN